MEESKELPSNYVTLVQLQERWLKERERKEREKEEEERKEREKAEQQRKLEEVRENRRQKQIGESSALVNYVSSSRPAFPRNRLTSNGRKAEAQKLKSEDSPMEAVAEFEKQKTHESEKKKKGKKKKKSKGKPKAEENLNGATAEFEPEENVSEVVTGKISKSEGTKSGFQRNVRHQQANRKAWGPKVPVDQTAALAQNFEDLSLIEGIRSDIRQNGGLQRVNRMRRVQKQKVVDQMATFAQNFEDPSLNEGTRSEFRENGGHKLGRAWVRKQKVQVDQTSALAQNIEDLSLNGGKEGNLRSTNGVSWRYPRVSRRFDGCWQPLRQRDGSDSMRVWVRKET